MADAQIHKICGITVARGMNEVTGMSEDYKNVEVDFVCSCKLEIKQNYMQIIVLS